MKTDETSDADTDKVDVQLADGVLTVSLPKAVTQPQACRTEIKN